MMSKSEPVSVNTSAKSRFRAHSLSLMPADFIPVTSQQKNRTASTAPCYSLPERLPQVCYPHSHLRQGNSCPSVVVNPFELTKDLICRADPFSTSEAELLQRLPIAPDPTPRHYLSEPRLDLPSNPLEVMQSPPELLAHCFQSVTFYVADGSDSTVTLLGDHPAQLTQQGVSQSTASLDTIESLLDSLAANNEREKRYLGDGDIIIIICKRTYRHAAPITALADILNYLGHHYSAGGVIVLSSLIGWIDSLFKIGEKKRTYNSLFLSLCETINQFLNKTKRIIPETARSFFKKLYYNCSLIAAACTVPADIFSHAYDAGFLKSKYVPSMICPLVITIPTLLTAIKTCINFKKTPPINENIEFNILKACNLVLEHIAIHGAAGTISADVAVYVGHPEIGMILILFMGFIGLCDGLVQCGERLDKGNINCRLPRPLQRFFLFMYHSFHKLAAKAPEFLKDSYLDIALVGMASTIIADTLSYFGKSSQTVTKILCPSIVTLMTSLSAIPSICPAIINRLTKPPTPRAHFLIHDDSIQEI